MLCGIYLIENNINKTAYIGQSYDIYKRWGEHIYSLDKNFHSNSHLQRAWNKYGKNNFSFSILEKCDESELDDKEIYYTNYYKSIGNIYNQIPGGRTDKRRTNLGKCLECGKEARPYSKYCNNHKYKCQTCKRRYGKKLNTKIHMLSCPYCNSKKSLKIYNILTKGKH